MQATVAVDGRASRSRPFASLPTARRPSWACATRGTMRTAWSALMSAPRVSTATSVDPRPGAHGSALVLPVTLSSSGGMCAQPLLQDQREPQRPHGIFGQLQRLLRLAAYGSPQLLSEPGALVRALSPLFVCFVGGQPHQIPSKPYGRSGVRETVPPTLAWHVGLPLKLSRRRVKAKQNS
jgi:hypothetical protein